MNWLTEKNKRRLRFWGKMALVVPLALSWDLFFRVVKFIFDCLEKFDDWGEKKLSDWVDRDRY